ncbi:MAG: DUF2807 domain-containing protein [Rikenellaceae bacterium]|nr:DUF2807 domain-containing protein [Rikenellaceae bacterium]
MRNIKFVLSVLVFVPLRLISHNSEPVIFSRYLDEIITGIEIGGAFQVEVTKGERTEAIFEINPELTEFIHIDLYKDGLLEIRVDEIPEGKNRLPYMKLYLTTPEINTITTTGINEIKFHGEFDLEDEDLNINLNGVSNISDMNVKCRNANIDSYGVSNIQAKITASDITAVFDGTSAGKLILDADRLELYAGGTSDLVLEGRSGYSCVTLYGARGVRAYDLNTAELRAKLYGASFLDVTVTDSFDVYLSGTAIFRYQGDPQKVVLRKD